MINTTPYCCYGTERSTIANREKLKMRPIGIDLFAGAGGLSLGFEQAGFDIKAAVEIDPVHCATHEYNFPKTKVIAQSVETLSGESIRKSANLGNQTIHCVFGGAPCQGFSLIGHRALDDPRNKLVLHFVRLVKELNASTFVFENVKGLATGKHKTFLFELITEFEKSGYQVRSPWQVLNAGHFGTPQSRERLFIMGAKIGSELPLYPEPTSNISGRIKKFPDLDFGPNCKDAIGDLPNADKYKRLSVSDSVKTTAYGPFSSYALNLRCQSNTSWFLGYMRDWDPTKLTSSARTKHTEISRNRFSETLPGEIEPISRFFKLSTDGVSNTLRAGTDSSRGAFTSPRPIHYLYNRCITVREMARLHGFPDWFRFNSTKWHGARQIGNSVPPPLGRAVAQQVVKALSFKIEAPNTSISLGSEKLLNYDNTEAASYFGVRKLISKRDRKSGAVKRKQVDIERERLQSEAASG